MDEESPTDQQQTPPEKAAPHPPPPDWSESEWFQRWLKLARREKE